MTRVFLVLLFTFSSCFASLAQNDSAVKDTTIVVKAPAISSFDSLFVFDDTTHSVKPTKPIGSILTQVISKAQNHAIELSNIKLELTNALDTLEMSVQLPKVKIIADRIKAKTLDSNNKFNLRYLQGMDNLILMVSEDNSSYNKVIQDRIKILSEVGIQLQNIKSDSLFNLTLRDTTLIPAVNKELGILKKSISNVDSTFLAQEIIAAKFQARIGENTVTFLELRQFLDNHKKLLEHQFLTKEINYLWEPSNFEKGEKLTKVITEALSLNSDLLILYLKRVSTTAIASVIILLLVYLFIKSSVKAISKEKEFASIILNRVEYFQKHTFWATLIILLPIYLVLFTKPPLAFVSLLSFSMVVASTFLIKKQFGLVFYRYWILFITPYILLALSGLHWEIAFQERWFILISSLLFISLGVLILVGLKNKKIPASNFLKLIAIFIIAMESFAALANILGRFNLAKTYAVTGAINFYRAVSLFLFIQVFLEMIYLLMEYSKKENDGFTSYFDFQDLQKRLKGIAIISATLIWIYGLLWHLGYFDYIYKWLTTFLNSNRVLGETEFQFGSILLLITILVFSTFLANNIAYFASIKDQKSGQTRKQRLGSSILLIRLAILCIGFFVGMTAAKIPLDKIAIVLGALSVGIGFGLQTIINNLVSGIILAFERPIQIGDEIQVGDISGTVKDVGIRASKIQGYDGSEIVMPNGDLLSKSLINWTLSDKKRRVELIIGVGYSSDMKLVKSVLEEVLSNERIMKNPHPSVYMQTFNDSSVDFRVLFWVETIDIWIDVRAEVMSTIFERFAENSIEIPFPKRDLYLKTIPSNWQEKVSKPGEDISPRKLDSESEKDSADENKKSPED